MNFQKLKTYLNNINIMCKDWYKWEKNSVYLALIKIIVLLVLPIFTALIPKLIIDAINNNISVYNMCIYVACISLLYSLFSWINPYVTNKLLGVSNINRLKYSLQLFNKAMQVDYQVLESLEGKELYARALKFVEKRDGDSSEFIDACIRFVSSTFGVFAYICLFSVIDIKTTLIIVVLCLLELFLNKSIIKYNLKKSKEVNSIIYKINYFYRQAYDLSMAKDLRINNFQSFLTHSFSKLIKLHFDILKYFSIQTFKFDLLVGLNSLIKNIILYIFLISSFVNGNISLSDFVFLFSLVAGFSSWLLNIVSQTLEILEISDDYNYFHDFISINTKSKAKKMINTIEHIEFKNVSFKYSDSSEYIIKNISFKINKNEKIALVGENGAGKTTLIKLICGFYYPTEGEILINGISINKINSKSLFSQISCVFQDFCVLPMSIKENISLKPNGQEDISKLKKSIKLSGLSSLIENLDKKENTVLVEGISDKAISLSGGETQKLLLARAIYKDSPLLILDEPTASMDSISENELYRKYNSISNGKISFFVSHRLASTKFCNKILVLQEGTIVESGNFVELIKNKNVYYNMFKTQSKYYLEDELIYEE